MEERRQPSFDPEAAALAITEGDLPDLDTPVIDIQNLEHQSWPDSRVIDAKSRPNQMDELIRRESGSTKEDEDARVVGAKIAENFKKLPKGREIF